MVKRLLVIKREAQEHFFLSVEKGVMTIGGNSTDAEAILRNLHISRIHCEVEPARPTAAVHRLFLARDPGPHS